MAALVRHFGDLADGQTACGICDFCAPDQCAAQRFRTATKAERKALLRVVAALRADIMKSTGKLHAELFPDGEMSRDVFEEVLGAMARAGLVRLADAVFEKDGKQIPYRKVGLTKAAHSLDETTALNLSMKAAPAAKKGKRPKKSAAAKKQKRTQTPDTPDRLEEALRSWRLAEAKRRNVPAFRIMGDQALRSIASKRPATAQELLAIPGIGISIVEKYGAQIYRILHEGRG